MHVSAEHQVSEPVVNQDESSGKLPPCVHCQESDNGSLLSPRVVLDLMVISNKTNTNFQSFGNCSRNTELMEKHITYLSICYIFCFHFFFSLLFLLAYLFGTDLVK